MKKLLLFLLPVLMLAACATTPKPVDYTFQNIMFTYPSNWKVDNEEMDGDRIKLYLVKDKDTFIYLDLEKMDEELLADLGDEDIIDAMASDAYSLFELDKDDEEMDIQDLDILQDGTEGDGFLVEYGGTNMGDPFTSRILCKMVGAYEVLVRTETMDQANQEEINEILNSIKLIL